MRNFPSRLSHSIDKNGMWYVLLRPSLLSSLSFHTSNGRASLAGVDRMTSYSSSLRKFWGSLRGTTPEGVQFVVKGEFAAEAKARCLCSHPRAGFLLLSLCSTLLVTSLTGHSTGGCCLQPLCFPTALSHGCSHTSPPLASSEGREFPPPLSLQIFPYVGMIQAFMIALWHSQQRLESSAEISDL